VKKDIHNVKRISRFGKIKKRDFSSLFTMLRSSIMEVIMKELSLHILDIVQNSIKANATFIEVILSESTIENTFKIIIKDNGCGMDEDTVKNVINPTRTTRKVGLGIPLLEEATNRCNGSFNIESQIGVGTTINCCFERNNIDRAPLGDISGTIMTIINSLMNCEFRYLHYVDEKFFELSTKKIKEVLGDNNLNSPEILLWIKEYVDESTNELYN